MNIRWNKGGRKMPYISIPESKLATMSKEEVYDAVFALLEMYWYYDGSVSDWELNPCTGECEIHFITKQGRNPA